MVARIVPGREVNEIPGVIPRRHIDAVTHILILVRGVGDAAGSEQ